MSRNMYLVTILLLVLASDHVIDGRDIKLVDHVEYLYRPFQYMFNSTYMSDGTIRLGNNLEHNYRQIPVHRLLVSAHSEFFRELFFTGNEDTVHNLDRPGHYYLSGETDYEPLMAVIEYMYKGKLDLRYKHINETKKIAFMALRLGVYPLFNSLDDYMCSRLATPADFIYYYRDGFDLVLTFPRLKAKCDEYLEENSAEIFFHESNDQLQFVEERLHDILAKETAILMIDKFFFLQNWLIYQNESHQPTFNAEVKERLCALIDLNHFTFRQLAGPVLQSKIFPADTVKRVMAKKGKIDESVDIDSWIEGNKKNEERKYYTIGRIIRDYNFFGTNVVILDDFDTTSASYMNYINFKMRPDHLTKLRNKFAVEITDSLTPTVATVWKTVLNYSQFYEILDINLYFPTQEVQGVKFSMYNNRYYHVVAGVVSGEFNPDLTFRDGYRTPPFSQTNQGLYIVPSHTNFRVTLKPFRGISTGRIGCADETVYFHFLQPYWIARIEFRAVNLDDITDTIEVALYNHTGHWHTSVMAYRNESSYIGMDIEQSVVSKIGLIPKGDKNLLCISHFAVY